MSRLFVRYIISLFCIIILCGCDPTPEQTERAKKEPLAYVGVESKLIRIAEALERIEKCLSESE